MAKGAARDKLMSGALDNLVNQFGSAYDCLRELVQNSIDAGSPEIEIWTEYEPGTQSDEGTILLHVDDYGVGMDEDIIDNQLTKLFASSKEDDLTKVGKFGIGFVSIFALNPEAVLLHTGRGGSWWEVLFSKDRSFTKTRLDVPVEGTQITLYLKGDEEAYKELVGKSFGALRYWCRYSEVPILFEDRAGLTALEGPVDINDEFGLAGPIAVTATCGDTVMSLRYDRSPFYGFFNRGLTLATFHDKDQVPGRFAWISFEIKSPYLEHTLSRETVMRDENFSKAMDMLGRAADEVLFPRLLETLEELASRPALDWASRRLYEQCLLFLSTEPDRLFEKVVERRILRLAGGGTATIAEVRDRVGHTGHLFVSSSATPLVRHLRDAGTPVLETPTIRRAGAGEGAGGHQGHGHEGAGTSRPRGYDELVQVRVVARAWKSRGLWRSLRSFLHLERRSYDVCRPEDVYLPVTIIEEPDAMLADLLSRTTRLLDEMDAGYERVMSCILQNPVDDPPLVLVGKSLEVLMPVVRSADLPPKHLKAAVNQDHPLLQSLRTLHGTMPSLAPALLARALLFYGGRRIALEDILRGALADRVEVR